MEQMCRSAIDAGLSGISITDHCNADFCISDNTYCNILHSAQEARRLAEKYKSELVVTVGVEMSDVLRKPDYTARLIKSIRPDSVIMSVHNVFRNNLPEHISRMNFGEMTDEEAYGIIKVYFRDLIRATAGVDFDICAHLTLPLRYSNGVYGKKLTLDDFSNEIKKILSTLIDRKKALEINTSDVHRQLYDFMPSENIVKLYYDMGGRLVTIGTDAHSPENIASGFDEARQMLRKTGFDSYCYYKNRSAVRVSL